MIKVWDDGQTNTEVQVCGSPSSQVPSACNPYICESEEGDNVCTIKRSFRCNTEWDVEQDLLDNNFREVKLVDNREDWFARLQYYFEL